MSSCSSNSSHLLVPEQGELQLSGDTSFQDCCAKYKPKKKKEFQIIKMSLEAKAVRSKEYKENLRLKFIEQCKRYVGTPCSARYKTPDEHIVPLYLDCCALVRKAVQDLEEDFGFVLGKWNQAYQMDTLPIALDEMTVRPGDLVFYEGTYSKGKQQNHNLVHVEIFLGGATGEATIGSRYQKETVSIFPSYKFENSLWKLSKVHFRSLDTWLSGECVSHCLEHPWTTVLGSTMGIDDQDYVRAANSDDDSQDHEEIAEPHRVAVEEGQDSVIIGDFERSMPVTPSKELLDMCSVQTVVPSHVLFPAICTPHQQELLEPSEKVCAIDSKLPDISHKAVYVEEDSVVMRRKRVKLTRKQSSVSSSDSSFSSLPRNSNKNKSSKIIKEVKKDYTVATLPRTYYVNKSNGYKLVKAALDRRGWTQIPFEQSFFTKYGMKWVERRSDIDYVAHISGQLVCHIPNNEVITTKTSLVNTLLEWAAVENMAHSVGEERRGKVPWLPDTYQLACPEDVLALLAMEDELIKERINSAATEGSKNIVGMEERGGTWIYKPSANNRGRGIRVVRGKKAVVELCYGIQTNDPSTSTPPAKGVVQRYIEDPLLIFSDIGSGTGSHSIAGYKFDIRSFLLIAKNDPSSVAYYHPGYARLSLSPYCDTDESLSDLTVHLTNAAVQKKGVSYKNMKEFQVQSVEDLADLLDQHGHTGNAEYMRHQVEHDMKLCMLDLVKAADPLLVKKVGYFDLLGCDFMVTLDNTLKLLEVNSNPALSRDNSTLEKLLPKLVDGTIEIILKAHGFPSKIIHKIPVPAVVPNTAADTEITSVMGTASGSDRDGNPVDFSCADVRGADSFVLLYDETTGFEYGKDVAWA